MFFKGHQSMVTGRNLINYVLTQPVDLIFFALNLLDLVMLINCLSKKTGISGSDC